MGRRAQLPLRRLSFRPQVELLESRTLLSFGPPNNFEVDANPLGVALADLNGDGKLDAVTANFGGGSVSVLLGKGDGTFQPAQSFAAGANASTVAIGDFNGDNKPDLAVGHLTGLGVSTTTVSVLLGVGDGTFQPPVDYAVGNNPIWVIAADLNGDNILDLVTANNDSVSVSVLLGNGDGTFQPAKSFAVGKNPIGIAAADLNGDKFPDLVVANSNSPGTVSILFGNGDGTFQSPVDYPVGKNTSGPAVGDFNGDGAPDLAVVSLASGDVTILLNDGHGVFQTGATYQVGPTPIGAVVGDFNGDGKLDLVIGYYDLTGNTTNVTTLLGNGDGTFQPPVDYSADVGPVGVAVGDLNGDGAPDIVAANVITSDVSVLLNLNDWAPPAPPGGHANFPDNGKLQREQTPAVQPADSAADFGRQTEVLFLLSRAHEDAVRDGKPVLSSRSAAHGTDGFELEGNVLRYDGMTGTFI